MSSRILGVTPTAPGFTKIAIRPQPCGLKFARGTVPTPHGNVDVEWRREGGQFTLKVTVPAGGSADVVLPVAGTQVSVDGVARKDAKRGAAIPVAAGTHEFAVTGVS
jgi:alpha-L-rhamnosidase